MAQERNKRKTNILYVGLNAYDDEGCFSPPAPWWCVRVSRQAVIQMAVQTRKEKEDPDDKQGVNSRAKAMDSALKENFA